MPRKKTKNIHMTGETLLEMCDITKRFPGVVALDRVNLSVEKGEVHVLVGENGAGKSTLMKILTGAYSKDKGQIFFMGKELYVKNPREALDLGISMIYQETSLVPHLNVAENIYLGREPLFPSGWLNKSKQYHWTEKILKKLHLRLLPTTPITKLGIAQRRMVEIAKALSADSKIMIMDEPTAALTEVEIDELFSLISQLKRTGISVIYISHRLEEITKIGDRITVLRDGQKISTSEISDVDIPSLIRMMVGRKGDETLYYKKEDAKIGEECLRVEGLSRKGHLEDIDFTVKKGEILGIAGLVGAGRTELVRAIVGADPVDRGKIFIEKKEVKIRSPHDAISAGIGLLPENRRDDGLALDLSVKDNITLANITRFTRFGWIRKSNEHSESEIYRKDLKIKCHQLNQSVKFLSGGNQQKILIARWLITNTKILIFDEPTRGIDVGTKAEIFGLINQLAKKGAAVIIISSYLPEILIMSDRIMVMREGRITARFEREEANQEKILHYATVG
jgi:ribose transport system ATP-binding protein